MEKDRRVVITGVGAVTPLGNTAPELWEGVRNGRCGIDRITNFPQEDLPVKIAAQVKGFDPIAAGLKPIDVRHYDY
ncbi:MAG: beta-ketoacyl-[Bacteroidales bacterium]|nr:beta-ketoacyl-[acyl-carrier-protein] synthase II [Bacteroidales bacterium]